MSTSPLHLALLAFSTSEKPTKPQEDRIKQFLQNDSGTESLDDAKFSQINGSATKADYLLGGRKFVAELKTINSNPKPALEERLKVRFAQKGAPIVYGQMGIAPILNRMPDGDQLSKMMNDVSARAVRRHLQKSNAQIGATKKRLAITSASGLSIMLNDSEPMVDATGIAFAIKSAFDTVVGGFPHIDYVWVSVECHRIRMPDGSLGYPQLIVFKDSTKVRELDFTASMIMAWAHFSGSVLHRLDHGGGWEAMQPIFDDGPPTLSLF